MLEVNSMEQNELLQRIAVDPAIQGGKPCIIGKGVIACAEFDTRNRLNRIPVPVY